MRYSPSLQGFYSSEIHGASIPPDAVDITEAEYAALIEAQAAGAEIRPDADGRPIAVMPPAPTEAEALMAWRAQAWLTRAEFIRSLRAHAILTFDDALNAAKGAWPTAFAGALSGLPTPMAEAAQLDWALATSIARQNPLFLAVLAFHAASAGLDTTAADALGDTIFGWIDPALPETSPETAPETGA